MRTVAALLAVVTCAGCAVGNAGSETSDTPRRDLAGRPTVLTGGPTPGALSGTPSSPTGTTAPRPGGGAGAGGGSTATTPGGSRGGAGGSGPAAYRSFVTLDDREGDADLGAPPYADLVQVVLADDGTHLRATVTVNASLSTRTRDGESMGIGVDLYPATSQRESDFQLFADGTPDGWYAYLQTPKGFVRYPGTFALGASRIEFAVPWSSLGNRRTGRVSAFVDWTQKSTALTGNPSSNDSAPVIGTTSWAR